MGLDVGIHEHREVVVRELLKALLVAPSVAKVLRQCNDLDFWMFGSKPVKGIGLGGSVVNNYNIRARAAGLDGWQKLL